MLQRFYVTNSCKSFDFAHPLCFLNYDTPEESRIVFTFIMFLRSESFDPEKRRPRRVTLKKSIKLIKVFFIKK